MASSSSTAVLVAGSLLVAGLGYGFLSMNSKPSSSSREITEIDDDEDHGDFITADEVAKIFDRLFLEMQSVFAQLMQQIQQIQQMGQQLPERQIKGLLHGEMERALTSKQKLVLDEHDIDYDCLEEATWEFLEKENEYPKVKHAVERFQKLWETATGEPVVGWRPGKEIKEREEEAVLSAEQTVEMAEKYFGALTDAMRILMNKFKAEGRNLQDPIVQQQLNMEFSQSANDAGEAALDEHGVSLRQFEKSVQAHSSNPAVGRALATLNMKQQQELTAMQQG